MALSALLLQNSLCQPEQEISFANTITHVLFETANVLKT